MRFLVPETIQTSAADCGPAALKSILGGFGVPASYGRLREACQTTLDGTSIDTIEDVARELGLDAEQLMVPVEHLQLDRALLPAVVVVTVPGGYAHFVVVWRRVGPFFQIMDPAEGRMWVRRSDFMESVYRHRQHVERAAWESWRDELRPELIDTANRAVEPAENEDELLYHGAVLLRIRGAVAPREGVRREIAEAVRQGEIRPAARMLAMLDPGVRRILPLLAIAIALLGTTTVLEGLIFRALFDLVTSVGIAQHRLITLGVLLAYALCLLLMEWDVARRFISVGREIEARMGMAFLTKIASLRNEYFGSRLVSDMAERANSIHEIRNVPVTAVRAIRAAVSLLATSIALVWLHPPALVPVVIGIVLMLALVGAFLTLFFESDVRARTHAGGLMRFYLDALIGLTTLHAHCAERAVRREHESLLTEWYRTVRRQISASVTLDTLLAFAGVAMTAAMLATQLRSGDDPGGVLLIAWWGLQLPMAAAELANTMQVWGVQRVIAMRLIEPLDAEVERGASSVIESPSGDHGVAIQFRDATFTLAGHDVLREVNLDISAGTHVAIIGRSGAGKSTLVSSLLGLVAPSRGELRIDGEPLDPDALRARTAWVDPAIQLWNASLEANVAYAARDRGQEHLPLVLREAELYDVLQRISDMQSPIGEGGGMLSGGEGQRVRVARALLQRQARLVILDEAFRGVDRETRRELLRRCRELWRDATMLCVTHEIEEAASFDRVLVMDDGQIIENDTPRALAADPASAYRRMRDAAARVREEVWGNPVWRRWTVSDGAVVETARSEVMP